MTDVGKVANFQWTIGGQLYLHWGYEPNGCFNCIMDADGKNIKDAGGKDSAPQYLPFQDANGNQVGCASVDINNGNDEIYLVGTIYPDMFLNLTNNPGNDHNPTWPANCISEKKMDAQNEGQEDFVFGYENTDNDQRKEADLLQACNELNIQCVKGDDLTQLADQNVDAILSLSNNWNVLGEFNKIREVVDRGIPLLILNAETNVKGAYNLSVEYATTKSSLDWMAGQIGGSGELAYYNINNNGFIQPLIDQFVKDNPEITAIPQEADYQANKITEAGVQALLAAHPNLKGIWANGFNKEVFWGVLNNKPEKPQAILCESNLDMLQYWKTQMDENSEFRCYASIKPGGTGYEGVYVAYYMLSGKQINPDALGGVEGNTFIYDYPIITNDNFDEWMGKIDSLQKIDGGNLVMPAMTPEEIQERWFIDAPAENLQGGQEVVKETGSLIGYAGDTPEQSQRKRDFQMACDEMGIQCMYGDVPDLIDQGVKAIVLNTNSAEVDSQAGSIQEAQKAGIPVFVLDAESKEQGAVNITIDHYGWAKTTLGWMMDKMGNQGQIAYFDLDSANRYSEELKELLKRNPKIEVVESREGDYPVEKIKPETVDFVKTYPDLKAVWTSTHINDALIGLLESGLSTSKWPVVLCEASLNGLDTWRSTVEKNPNFDCFALANPPGIAYDAAYAAYYSTQGAKIDEKAFEGARKNSLYVNMPIIMSKDLQAWYDRTKNEGNEFVDEHMSPEEIREKWFVE